MRLKHYRHANRSVSLFLPDLEATGAGMMMLALAEGLIARSFSVDLVVARSHGRLINSIPHDVRFIDLATHRASRSVFALARYLRKTRPDVVFASEHYGGLPILYSLSIICSDARCIIRQDNTWSRAAVTRLSGRHKLITPIAVKTMFRRAEIVAVSRGVADDLVAHFPQLANNVQVIYNPVVSDALRAHAREAPPHEWLRPGEPPVLVAAGRLDPAKGFDLLIDAFARVAQRCSARLLILGEGPEREPLQNRIRNARLEGRCALAGFQENALAFIARARLFVLSSRVEGLPTVLIEALATGVPVVAADCPCGPREILADGRYGTLVPPQSVDALATAILESLAHPAPPQPDLEQWLDQFTVATSIERHLALIDAALAAPPPHRRRAPLVLR